MNDTGIDGYRVYLERRDGKADLLNRRLASRDEFFGDLEANLSGQSITSIGKCSRATWAVGGPIPESTGGCCFCWRPPS